MLIKNIALTSLIILSAYCGFAQDAQFSQYYANGVYLNPAYIGINQGMTLTASYRHQWPYVMGSFRTIEAGLTFYEPCLNSGFGLNLFQHTEGEGLLQTTSASLGYAYTLKFNGASSLHFGLQASAVFKNIDWTRLRFSDQIDPFFGFQDPNGAPIPTAAPYPFERDVYPDFHFGVIYRSQWNKTSGGTRSDTDFSAGLAFHHLLQPSESLQMGLSNRTPMRLTVHAAAKFLNNFFSSRRLKNWYIVPSVRLDWQGFAAPIGGTAGVPEGYGQLSSFSGGFYMSLHPIYAGLFYQNTNPFVVRSTNSFITILGVELKWNDSKMLIGMSYDANSTGLSTEGGGTFEFTIRYNDSGTGSLFCRGGRYGGSKRTSPCPMGIY